MNLLSAIPPKDVKDVPIEDTTKNNTKVIVIVLTLLALLILITLIVFYVTHVRRRNFKKQGNIYGSIRLFNIKQFLFVALKLKFRRLFAIAILLSTRSVLWNVFSQPIYVDFCCCLINIVFGCLIFRLTCFTRRQSRCTYDYGTTPRSVWVVDLCRINLPKCTAWAIPAMKKTTRFFFEIPSVG